MKKLFLLFLTLIISLSFAACSNTKEEKDQSHSNDKVQVEHNNIIIGGTNDNSEVEIYEEKFDSPIILVDNDILTISCVGKFQGEIPTDGKYGMGYRIIGENKTDKYINIVPVNFSIDGYMLNMQDGFWISSKDIAPKKKISAVLYISPNRVTAIDISSIEDMINVDGQFSIMTSDDGASYSSNTLRRESFINVLP